jgi:hypothetical protein
MKNLIHHTDHLTIYAIILLIIGLTLRSFIGKRRFNRRGVGGTQYFKSYSVAVVTTTIEKVANVIATLMIIGSVFLYLIK